MNIKSLSAGLSFRGNVTGRQQKYYVFEGKDAFFVFSFSRLKPKSGYFNMVSSDAVTHVQRLTRGGAGCYRSISQQAFPETKAHRFGAGSLERALCVGCVWQRKNRSSPQRQTAVLQHQ